jgi:hypothetical protein
MLQIEPRINYPITYNLGNPTDTNTYYARAYIYDGVDADTLLDTVDLTDLGNQRFKKNWQTPADVSGQGRYITIFIRVFTDSSHTAESDTYGRVEEKLLIKQGWSPVFGGGGGGVDLDYKKVRKIIAEEMDKMPKPKKTKEINLSPLLNEIGLVRESLSGIEINPQVNINLNSILDKVDSLDAKVKKYIEQNKPEPTDLIPLMDEINKIKEEIASLSGKIENVAKEKSESVISSVEAIRGDFKKIPVISVEKTGIQEEPKKEINTHRKFY